MISYFMNDFQESVRNTLGIVFENEIKIYSCNEVLT